LTSAFADVCRSVRQLGRTVLHQLPHHVRSSGARFAPGIKESAGRKKGRGSTGHGNRYLARALGEAAVAAGETDTSLGNATGASPNAAAKREPSSRSDASSWSSSGTCSPIPRPASTTSAPITTTTASARNARNATTSANSKHWATRSPSNPPPDHGFPSSRLRDTSYAEPVVPFARPRLDFRIRRKRWSAYGVTVRDRSLGVKQGGQACVMRWAASPCC
jgi:hypothetical protein